MPAYVIFTYDTNHRGHPVVVLYVIRPIEIN